MVLHCIRESVQIVCSSIDKKGRLRGTRSNFVKGNLKNKMTVVEFGISICLLDSFVGVGDELDLGKLGKFHVDCVASGSD